MGNQSWMVAWNSCKRLTADACRPIETKRRPTSSSQIGKAQRLKSGNLELSGKAVGAEFAAGIDVSRKKRTKTDHMCRRFQRGANLSYLQPKAIAAVTWLSVRRRTFVVVDFTP